MTTSIITDNSNMLINEVSLDQENMRLDQVLAEIYTDYSRSRLQQWLASGYITLDGVTCKKATAKVKVKAGTIIGVDKALLERKGLFKINSDDDRIQPENIALDIVYQDEDIIIINKPNNLVVHPGAGNRSGTLVNGLLYHFPELASLPRAGIIHRLDKNTTGLMVVARNDAAHFSLVKQLQKRTVTRKYVALVNGLLISGGTLESNIGRHKTNRLKMAVHADDEENIRSKPAITHYRILKKYPRHTLIEVSLETGRTHQIRVHMSYKGYPLVGDSLYGRVYAVPKEFTSEQQEYWCHFKRQALAAVELGFEHPSSKEYVSFNIDIPEDMQGLITILDESVNK